MTIQDENGTALIGFIDIGGVAIPRAVLAKGMPDIGRFERWLEVAKDIVCYMEEHQDRLPPFTERLTVEDGADLIATLQELGALRIATAFELDRELAK